MTPRILIFILLLSSCALGCRVRNGRVSAEGSQSNVNHGSPGQSEALSRILSSATISPYQLEEYTNQHDEYETKFVDFKPIWRRLQIPRDEDGDFDGFDPSVTRWRAEIIDAGKSDESLVKIIFKLSAYGGADRRYLVFDKAQGSSGEEQWSFSGNIDIIGNYEASEETEYHRVVMNSKHVWLVLRSDPRIGTGISGSDETWYIIHEGPPREVLKYPLEGGRVMGQLSDLEYKARISPTDVADGNLAQYVRYTVSFGAASSPKFRWLFSKRVRACFVWNEIQCKFILDESKSDVSEEELDTTFGSWNEQRFVKYNLRLFPGLAQAANSEQRSWLRSLIDTMPEGTEKSALIKSLN